MATKYSVYTELLQLEEMKQIARQFVSDSFSIHKLDGHYKGHDEYSVVFEFILEGQVDGAISYFAQSIKELNKQTTVLVTKEKVEMEYVY